MKKQYQIFTLVILLVFFAPAIVGLNNGLIQDFTNAVKNYDFTIMLISLALLGLCFMLELLFLGYKKSSIYHLLHPDKSVISDVVVGLAYTLGAFFFLKTLYYLSLKEFFPELYKRPGVRSAPVFTMWYVPLLLFYLAVADFLKYLLHRLMHEIDFLWQIHKFHHSATSFVVLSGNRVHPLEHVMQKLFVSFPLVLMGIGIEMYLSVIVIMLFIDKLQHSMLDWDYGFIGKYLIYSPIGHRIHHSKLREHWDKNYGDMFVLWDRLLGTYYRGNKVNEQVGVTDNWLNKEGLVYDLWHCVYLSFRSFKQSLRKNRWRGEHLQKDNK